MRNELPLQILSQNISLFERQSAPPYHHDHRVKKERESADGTIHTASLHQVGIGNKGSISPLTSSIMTLCLTPSGAEDKALNHSTGGKTVEHEEQSTVTLLQFMRTLVEAYPEGVLAKDASGMIPFVPVLRSWIDN